MIIQNTPRWIFGVRTRTEPFFTWVGLKANDCFMRRRRENREFGSILVRKWSSQTATIAQRMAIITGRRVSDNPSQTQKATRHVCFPILQECRMIQRWGRRQVSRQVRRRNRTRLRSRAGRDTRPRTLQRRNPASATRTRQPSRRSQRDSPRGP